MNWIAFVVLVIAAVLSFLDWYGNPTAPRRWADIRLALCIFIVGVICIWVFGSIEPNIHVGD